MAATTTYRLKHPITVDGLTVTELTFRRPKVRDIRLMEKQGANKMDQVVFLVAQLAEVTPATVDELDAEDLGGLAVIVEGFIEGAVPTP